MTIDEVAPYVGYVFIATIIFVLGQVFGLLLGMELLRPDSQNAVIRFVAKGARFLIGPDKRELLDAKPEVVEPETSSGVAPLDPELKVPVERVESNGIKLPSFGRPEIATFRHEDYEEWLVCCAGGEMLTPGKQFYIIPITNEPDDKFFSLCMEHRELPTWKALSP